jgi:hypothetical protein
VEADLPHIGMSARLQRVSPGMPAGRVGVECDVCPLPERHRHCPGLWRGEITLGYTGDGKRARRKVSGTTKAAVVDKLRDLRLHLDKGITPKAGYAHYTVRQAAADWLASGLDGRSPKTVTKNQNVLEPILTSGDRAELLDRVRAELPVIGELGGAGAGPGVGVADRDTVSAHPPRLRRRRGGLARLAGWPGGRPARWRPGGCTSICGPPPSSTREQRPPAYGAACRHCRRFTGTARPMT